MPDGEKRYILAPEGIKVGQTVISGEQVAPEVGNTLLLQYIPLGTIVHNIELAPGKGGVLARSAGSYAPVAGKGWLKYAVMKMPSGETRMILITCYATVGRSFKQRPFFAKKMGKEAGRKETGGQDAGQRVTEECSNEPCRSPYGWW